MATATAIENIGWRMSDQSVKRWRMSDMPLSEYGLYTEVVLASEYDAVFSRYEHSETKVQWLLHDSQKLVKERDELKSVLEAVRSQMCWERDRDQLTMGFKDLHDDVTKALEVKNE
jgi:hypothetical protein